MIQANIIEIHLTFTARDSHIAFGTKANSNFINIGQDNTLIGECLKWNYPFSPCVGLCSASGGVSSLDDIAALRELVPLGVEGAIVGKALYAGAFTLAEALDVAGH